MASEQSIVNELEKIVQHDVTLKNETCQSSTEAHMVFEKPISEVETVTNTEFVQNCIVETNSEMTKDAVDTMEIDDGILKSNVLPNVAINHDTNVEKHSESSDNQIFNGCNNTEDKFSLEQRELPTVMKNHGSTDDNTNVQPLHIADKSANAKVQQIAIDTKVSSLGALAIAYENSDSESESEEKTMGTCKPCEKDILVDKKQSIKEYRVTERASSDDENEMDSEEDSSSSSSSSSESSADSDGDAASQSDDSTNRHKKTRKSKSVKIKDEKGELDDLPPIEDLKISVPEVLCDPLGEVGWMVDQLVVVRPKPEKPTLNLDTVLFVDRGRRVLGRVFDVFGQVAEPHYCVRFNSSKHIEECDIKVGMTVYYCPNTPYTTVVFLHDLLKMKGTDVGGDDEHPEFSDDEEERAYYEKLKKQKNEKTNKQTPDVPSKRKRSNADWQSGHPWSSNWKSQNNDHGNQPYNHGMTEWGPKPRQSSAHYPQNSWPRLPFQRNPWSQQHTFQKNTWPHPTPMQMHSMQSAYPVQCNTETSANTSNSAQGTQQSQYDVQYSFNQQQNLMYKNDDAYDQSPRFGSGFEYYASSSPNTFSCPPMRFPRMQWNSRPALPPGQPGMPWLPLPPPPPPPCT
ncbi:H/ACA ribonucleoprotein complex non-core subunit NAF1 [Cephus cinctus]|uniref:H/ACA ribonucleoprotein complex non-core subunit NAF1 n=1 Tax=Cephus cinctus TaxID=211228 RepID=A0AAJ7BKH6_CEPCN|nr:H/ACA ribonucleoprotein complex non-core subunit NAF1 [Cephus cinctus]